jgi:heptosyltransferase-2
VARKILVIPKGFLGDVLLTSPVLEVLKASEPECKITVLCSPKLADYVSRDPLVDDIMVLDRSAEYRGWGGIKRFAQLIAERGFDCAYSFHQSPRTALLLWRAKVPVRVGYAGSLLSFLYTRRVHKTAKFHEVVRSLELVREDLNTETGEEVDRLAKLGPSHVSEFGRLRVPPVDDLLVSDRVKQTYEDQKPYIVLAPGSAWETKRWYAEGYREVAQSLMQQGFRVVLTGAPSDADVCVDVAEGLSVANLCGETSMDDLVALVKWSRGVVCNDSMTLHIASALQVPTVVVFCATSPRFGFGPWKNRAVVVEKHDLFCKPCRRHGSHRCPTGTNACMTGVPSREVLEAFHSLLSVREGAAGPGRLHVIE